MAPNVDYQMTSATYSDGARGIYQTLGVMRGLVTAGRCHPAVLNAARTAIFLAPPKDDLAEVTALFESVRDHIRYTRDVLNTETVSTPEKTLQARAGDCDDQVVLLCAMCEAVGYPTRFVIAGNSPTCEYEHVYCQVFAAGQWIDCDPTEANPIGWAPPNPTIIAYEDI